MFLKDVDELRGAGDFARSYTWDVKFESSKGDLNLNWFPATSIEEPLYSVDIFNITPANRDIAIPKALNSNSLGMTFLDYEDLKITKWLKNWVLTEMFNDGKGVTPVGDCVKLITILKLNGSKEVVDTVRYWVLPSAELIDSLSSDESLRLFSASFLIMGKVD